MILFVLFCTETRITWALATRTHSAGFWSLGPLTRTPGAWPPPPNPRSLEIFELSGMCVLTVFSLFCISGSVNLNIHAGQADERPFVLLFVCRILPSRWNQIQRSPGDPSWITLALHPKVHATQSVWGCHCGGAGIPCVSADRYFSQYWHKWSIWWSRIRHETTTVKTNGWGLRKTHLAGLD